MSVHVLATAAMEASSAPERSHGEPTSRLDGVDADNDHGWRRGQRNATVSDAEDVLHAAGWQCFLADGSTENRLHSGLHTQRDELRARSTALSLVAESSKMRESDHCTLVGLVTWLVDRQRARAPGGVVKTRVAEAPVAIRGTPA